ncbi:MAG TPA: tetraacyldisaccharide 4'-kinase [Vicinamibacterales bacterium]|nr:tetraacyldisaccharide 4'-kinase [Vicinamibacterales bacterium]
MNPVSALYGAVARARRSRYARHPDRRRHLHRPVISVGNLVVGGSGKTPVVAAVARLLTEAGERPVILSRGYKRRERGRDPLIVSDGARVLATVEQSGDEPQMLARSLPGVPVVVSPDRHASGLLAESRLQPTVFLLDDGFQHLRLARDIDLLVIGAADLEESLLPSGRLREPLSAARAADALLVRGSDEDVRRVSAAAAVATAFRLDMIYDSPGSVGDRGARLSGSPREPEGFAPQQSSDGRLRVVVVAGIARPERFVAAVREQGCEIVREIVFRDHHWFTDADVARIERAAVETGADAVITTEKDAVRLEMFLAGPASAAAEAMADESPEPALRTAIHAVRRPGSAHAVRRPGSAHAVRRPGSAQAVRRPGSAERTRQTNLPWLVLPMRVSIEPASAFRSWLMARLATARATESPA